MAPMPYLVTRGIVLRETETKETDKILTILTADRGKIPVIARGAREKKLQICRLCPAPGLFGVDALSAGGMVLCS
ncbi:MAG: recombination protein O N-terminal domain-containing protein [Dysosmobacter sp.]